MCVVLSELAGILNGGGVVSGGSACGIVKNS